jgi:choline transport protein
VFQVKNASITVPRMMIVTTIVNGFLGSASIITYMYVIQDIQQQILESTAVYPWVAVFAIATGSNAGAICMTIPFIVISFGK